jgi:hypothetical protein
VPDNFYFFWCSTTATAIVVVACAVPFFLAPWNFPSLGSSLTVRFQTANIGHIDSPSSNSNGMNTYS